jgi:hypothetical protein
MFKVKLRVMLTTARGSAVSPRFQAAGCGREGTPPKSSLNFIYIYIFEARTARDGGENIVHPEPILPF